MRRASQQRSNPNRATIPSRRTSPQGRPWHRPLVFFPVALVFLAGCFEPPSGTHRYIFTLFALDTVLVLDDASTKEQLLAAMDGNIIAQAELIGLYR